MKIVIAGGSGFVGQALSSFMKGAGHEVVILSRSASGATGWDGKTLGPWVKTLEGAGGVVNLSGLSVSNRWTAENRRRIIDSRVESTRAIGEALLAVKNPPAVWINASAIGFYGDTGEAPVDESSPSGATFLAEVCRVWEAAVCDTKPPKTRRVVLRLGVVLGRGGPLATLAKITRAGLGGSAGDGRQWMSWIHVEDLCRLIQWEMEDPKAPALVNGCSLNPVQNKDFMSNLRRACRRPWSPPGPKFVMKVAARVLGIETTPIFESCRAVPKAALAAGFEFRFPGIEEALRDLL